MKNVLKKCTAMIVLSMVSVLLLFAEETPIENLYEYTLDNGLSVFVAENHSAPLVYIEIAVRAGSVAQSPENAGLFHLYEHMMFKGNSKYRNSQAMQTALNDMGVSNWNGTTGFDRVNYFITVPTDQFENGLEFWSYAIREPLMTPKEFEDEKKVVISEITGYFAQPGEQQMYFFAKNVFPEAPWTYDPCGPVEVIQNATVEQLRAIQNKYYIPNNAAVFVGGDVNPDEAYELVKKVYGDWKKGDDPWKEEAKPYSLNPLDAPLYCVLPYDELSPQLAEISVVYRGPDADFAKDDAAVGEALSQILSDPNGIYAKTIVGNKKLQVPDVSYVWGNYQISRRHGAIYFGCDVYNPSDKLAERTKEFYKTLTQKALPAVEKDKSLDSQAKKDKLIQIFKDGLTWETQTPNSLLSNLSYYWTYSTRDYYVNREASYKKIEKKDINEYLKNYVYNSNPIIVVYVNPDVYEQTKAEFDNAGFVQITAENSFWWSK